MQLLLSLSHSAVRAAVMAVWRWYRRLRREVVCKTALVGILALSHQARRVGATPLRDGLAGGGIDGGAGVTGGSLERASELAASQWTDASGGKRSAGETVGGGRRFPADSQRGAGWSGVIGLMKSDALKRIRSRADSDKGKTFLKHKVGHTRPGEHIPQLKVCDEKKIKAGWAYSIYRLQVVAKMSKFRNASIGLY